MPPFSRRKPPAADRLCWVVATCIPPIISRHTYRGISSSASTLVVKLTRPRTSPLGVLFLHRVLKTVQATMEVPSRQWARRRWGQLVPVAGVYRITHHPVHADMPQEVAVIKGRR